MIHFTWWFFHFLLIHHGYSTRIYWNTLCVHAFSSIYLRWWFWYITQYLLGLNAYFLISSYVHYWKNIYKKNLKIGLLQIALLQNISCFFYLPVRAALLPFLLTNHNVRNSLRHNWLSVDVYTVFPLSIQDRSNNNLSSLDLSIFLKCVFPIVNPDLFVNCHLCLHWRLAETWKLNQNSFYFCTYTLTKFNLSHYCPTTSNWSRQYFCMIHCDLGR